MCTALTTPWSASRDIPTDGIVYFTAPDGATLDAGTGYHLVFQGSGNSGNDARASYAGGDGQTGGTGWTIEDALRNERHARGSSAATPSASWSGARSGPTPALRG